MRRFYNTEDLIGKEFEFGAAGPNKYDCYNLCREVAKRNGLAFPEYQSDSKPSVIHGLIDEGKQKFVKIEKPEPFCIVTLVVIPPYVSHVGIVLDPPYFIHTMEKTGVAVGRLDSIEWVKRIRGYFRYERGMVTNEIS